MSDMHFTSKLPEVEPQAPRIQVEKWSGWAIRCTGCGGIEYRRSKMLADMRANVVRKEHDCAVPVRRKQQ